MYTSNEAQEAYPMKRRISRTFLMIAGIITVAVILVSQSFYQHSSSSAVKKENKTEHADKFVSVAPSDVVPSPAVQLDKITPELLKIFKSETPATASAFPIAQTAVSFIKTLLRATISPNAP